MHETPHLLILGGTTEARRLAESLVTPAGPRVTTSLAGRVARPVPPPGEIRIGGFGGPEGLAHWLREHRVDALIDATHPFAGTISRNAARAAACAHVPLLALRRPSWAPGEGDDWHRVGSLEEAAKALPGLGRRVFLTTGRMGLATFAAAEGPAAGGGGDGGDTRDAHDAHDARDDLWYLVRSVDPPEPPYPRRLETLLDRGPFTLEDERDLLRRHRIDVLVTKDSGGAATAPKLRAAREAGLPVVVVGRPPAPEGVGVAETVEEALAWAVRHVPRGAPDRAPDR